MRGTRCPVIIGTVLAGLTLLAGCTHPDAATPASASSASAPAAASTASSSPAGTTAAGATTAPAGDTSTVGATPPAVSTAAAAAGPGLCTPTVARFSVTSASGGDNHFGFEVHVVNASSTPCVTTGYPGVALLDAGGQQIVQAQRTGSGYLGGLASGASPPQLVLQPGDEATAVIEGLNGNPTGPPCGSSPSLVFTLPDNTDATTLTHETPTCTGLQVHPLLAGNSGSQL